MARKETSIDVKGFETTFLVQKTSRLQADISGSQGYYTKMKHLKSTTPFQNRFVSSFNSQVNPTVLPGSIAPTIQVGYIVSELNDEITTEDNNNLIIE